MDLKVVMLGKDGSGKTSLITQFVGLPKPTFPNNVPFEDFYRKTVSIGGNSINFDIFDSFSIEESSLLRDQYIKCGSCFIIIYSIDSLKSFEVAKTSREYIYKTKEIESNKHLSVVLCGNKCDLEMQRKVSYKEGQQIAEKWNATFFESSVYQNINTDDIFMEVAKNYKENKQHITKNNEIKSNCFVFFKLVKNNFKSNKMGFSFNFILFEYRPPKNNHTAR
ncbi:hypothetical protein EIN_339500 [Entamoeba invadens IP1]|uniref:Uncharacterized protein n=1 Tax=Entamoeba invadens IP1 TaxID=370355 RepID=A0A0A1U7E5_ENTIV|nr:hypothetical protein EIN_339500 [Entamoeba invadens IP1]ELP90259.1 hypothetical protein EIN_339500 [Entamoeba invadens IP1]|eukprot:XP_004257030.1 hypothetical protein EIN_339500 [Entamoeba invadens IP1]